jgi:DNA-binding response OmpR family regulator
VAAVGSARADDRLSSFAPSLPHRCVLVVEDDSMIASFLIDDLEELGFAVMGPASNLTEAVAIASTMAPDCALIDIALGGESALPVAQILTERHIPFAFMTGASESLEGRFHDIPALLKPFTVNELRAILQLILSSHAPST